MKRRTLIKGGLAGLASLPLPNLMGSSSLMNLMFNRFKDPFEPSWDSLSQYQVPEWFRDAKFGMWAHWGPQSQPERGDWYAREMYIEGSDKYKFHTEHYGHPSQFGFKDVINEWKAEKWDPEAIVSLYKKTGARYFMALANHHDNFDLWNSKHHNWNAVKLGPRKDLIAGWANAAKKNDLPFGVSIHSAHAWSWYETSQRADTYGSLAGIFYDGKLTAADGKGKWWDGFDPKELYAQNHPLSENSSDNMAIHRQWNWNNGVYPPTKKYCENFYKRVIDILDNYDPAMIYFDDTALPFWPINDTGLRIATYMYNRSIKKYGRLDAVIFGKILDETQRKCMVWDIERGHSNQVEPLPWQTDTCIGVWHYDRRIYDSNNYKTATTVIHTLADVVSKNGNLLLNIPLRGDGSIDEKEMRVIESVGDWMKINSEAIYCTRPWRIYGEGPAIENAAPINAQGFNEGRGKPYTAEDIRFTQKGKAIYAILLGWPGSKTILIKSLNSGAGKAENVQLLGYHGSLESEQNTDGLKVTLPDRHPCKDAFVLKIEGNII